MSASIAEQRTSQFYQWEAHCRGWQCFEDPVHLEPIFKPFTFRPTPITQIDDGIRHTPLSWVTALVTGKLQKENTVGHQEEDDEPAAYVFENDARHYGFSVIFPKEHTVGAHEMEQLLCMLSYSKYPISFEIIANHTEISIQIVCREPDRTHVYSQIKAFFPDSVLLDSSETLFDIIAESECTYILDFGLSEEFMRPLASQERFKLDPYIGLFGSLEHLEKGQQAIIQVLFQGTVNSWAESIIHSVTDRDGKSFFIDAPEMVDLAHEKVSSPLYGVVVRVISQAETEDEALSILENAGNAIMHLSQSSANALRPLATEAYSFELRLQDVVLRQSHRQGMILNSKELVTLVHFPTDTITSSRLKHDAKNSKPIPSAASGHDLILGRNIHHGKEQLASISASQRLKHMHVLGATGTGKSTFLLNLISQDMQLGNGIAVLDPHGDLIESILTQVPEDRINDVIIIDPSDADFPIGFNVLSAHSEIEKDVLSSDLVAVFRRLSSSWGDQMNSVLANAILAILESSEGGTLIDLRRFLVEKSFRDTFLKSVADPSIVYYWNKEYPLLKSSSIGSILTRLDTFLRPKLIRNMVAQKSGPDFEWILDTKKIVLVKLSQGIIGIENSYLLGTFIVSKIHQAAMARQVKHKDLRTDYYMYIDEFQNFITPSLSSILSGARKYHLGLILAHQDMQQLTKYDTELASSVASNAGTRVCFRLGDTDAKKFENTFASFDANDLQGLDTGHAIVRIERPENDFSISITPVESKSQEESEKLQQEILNQSRKTYGSERSVVEEQIASMMHHHTSEPEAEKKEKPVMRETSNEEPALNVPKPRVDKDVPMPTITQISHPTTKKQIEKKEQSQHRYLQTLIKKMAESRGYKASIEEPTPDGKGRVDVALERKGKKIACEISVTSTDIYEVHNIEKCLKAGYDMIIECSTERKTLENIRKAVQQNLSPTQQEKILILDPDGLFLYLDTEIAKDASTETLVKGYRVKVEYDALSEEDMKKKRDAISEMVVKSIKKMKK